MPRCPTTSVPPVLSSPVFCPRWSLTRLPPLLSVSALITTVTGFASSHRLDYAAHLLGFLAAAVPHLCAMLLAPEGDPNALDILIPRTHVEVVSGPWASYWISAEEAEMASYMSRGTYVDAIPPPEANVISGMWLYKGVAKYVVSTLGMGLVLGGKQPVTLRGFSDLSWADDAESLRSTQGYCFSLGTRAVSCRSTRVSSVSSSSYEAEVYVAAMAAQELCWLSFLLTDLGKRPCSPLVLFADNRSDILLCEEPQLVGKAKHIQLCCFLLRELQQRGQALARRVVSEANTADIFTKALLTCDHK
ncbi:unnamed protein product, partial [Closterium sp. NIES-53]